jgi:DnaJ-class molecular chaperone
MLGKQGVSDMIECPECEGYGYIEIDDPQPHAGGWNCGYIDTTWTECEHCNGLGEIEPEEEE